MKAWTCALWGLLTLMSHGCRGAVPEPEARYVQIALEARSTAGGPVGGASLHIGAHMALTNDRGVAHLSDIEASRSFELEGKCPEGYSGQTLRRTMPRAVLASVQRFSLDLLCEPREVDVTLAVLTEGCGEMNVTLNGEPVGVTKNQLLHLVTRRELHKDTETFDISVSAVEGNCHLETSTRTFLVRASSPGVWARFVGTVPPTNRQRNSSGREAESVKPYRL